MCVSDLLRCDMVAIPRSTQVSSRPPLISQLVGNVISRISPVTESRENYYPSLGILICGNTLRFAFFPFMVECAPCADAIVSQPITLVHSSGILRVMEEVFAFICYYISCMVQNCQFIQDVRSFAPQRRKAYAGLVDMRTALELKVETLEEELAELRKQLHDLEMQLGGKRRKQ